MRESAYKGEVSMYKLNDIHNSDGKGNFEKMVISEAERVKPIIKEQFLREYILGTGDTYEIFNIYCKTFGVDRMLETRMIIIKPAQQNEDEDIFFLKNTSEQYIFEYILLLKKKKKNHLFLITTLLEQQEITSVLEKIHNTMKACYGYDVMAVYSKIASIADAPASYERLKRCVGYSFYSDSCEILYENDIKINENAVSVQAEYGAIEHAVKTGDMEKLKMLLSGFFKTLEKAMPTPAVAKTYCLELYVCIIRCCSVEKIEKYMKGIVSVQAAKKLSEIKSFIEQNGFEIAKANAPEGWRLPTDEDWKKLERAMGMSQGDADAMGFRGTMEGTLLQQDVTGTGIALPLGGYAIVLGRPATLRFRHWREFGYFWTATEEKNETPFPDAYYRKISFRSSQIERGITRIVDSNYETNYPKHMSVRYVRDAVD